MGDRDSYAESVAEQLADAVAGRDLLAQEVARLQNKIDVAIENVTASSCGYCRETWRILKSNHA